MAKKKRKKLRVSKREARERILNIVPVLRETYPDAKIALNFSNPLELYVATVLSAQCTDVRVNMVTSDLFKKYESVEDWASTELEELQNDIRSTGFYRNKAKNIRNGCRYMIENFGGEVPGTMEELLKLPGVGRKTANVLLGNVFDTPGITCDTHVIRLSRRLELSEHSDPVKLEFDLAEIVDREDWTDFSHLIIFHGRNTCKARKPDCEACTISEYCPSAFNPEKW